MSKILYANGDSFVFGMECIDHYDKTPANKEFAFPKQLADLMNIDIHINAAYNGATNEFIFRNTLLDILNFEKQGYAPEDVFVLVGITSLHRLEIDGNRFLEQVPKKFIETKVITDPMFPVEYHKYGTMFVNPGFGFGVNHYESNTKINVDDMINPWCSQFIWTETVQMLSQEARILSLHEILKSKGYRHLFVNTVCSLERTQHIDMSNKNFYKLETDAFYQWADTTHPSSRRKFNHFDATAHIAYANILHQYILKTL